MGSSKPSLKSNDKEGFLRAFTDEYADLQADYHVKLEMVVEPSGRKGVLRITLTALSPQDGHTGLAAAYYQCEYPTAQVESLEACLFRCAVRLERVLRDRHAYPMGKA
jgi:hypothetical protein